MRYIPVLLLIGLIVLSPDACARGAVLVIIDGLGSSYLSSHTASYVSGGAIEPVEVKAFGRADAQYQLKVPVPATEFGHAVIVTGYSGASQEVVTFYHATIFDALKDDGYIALGILENGDTNEMLAELDACVHNEDHSIYDPDFKFIENGNNIPSTVAHMMKGYPVLPPGKAGKDPYARYIEYNAWALGFTTDLVAFMNESYPNMDYILIVNAGGLDSAGHNFGYKGYRAVLSGLDGDIDGLIDACEASGTLLIVTGDHGMSFPDDSKKGSHAAPQVASRNESLLVPLLIFSNITMESGGIYGQECLAPTLLSLLDEPDTMSLGDGEPLPVKERPALYLRSKSPVSVTVSGNGLNASASFSGLYHIKGLEKGGYMVSYGGTQTTVHLVHDEILDLKEGGQSPPVVPPWMAYVAVAGISVAGICVALKLAWMRR